MKRLIALICAFMIAAIAIPFGSGAEQNLAELKPYEGDELVVITTHLPDAMVGEAYFAHISTNYPESSVSMEEWWNPGSGMVLPSIGLRLSRNGDISGTPTRAGIFSFFVCVIAEGAPNDAYAKIMITIKPEEVVPTPSPTPEITPSPEPTAVPEPTPTAEPSAKPSAGPGPTPGPTPSPAPTPDPGKPTTPPSPKPTVHPTPRPTSNPNLPRPTPTSGPARTSAPGGRETAQPTIGASPTPFLPGAGCRFEADSIIYYIPGQQFNVTLVSGMGINCIPGNIIDNLPSGVQTYTTENNSCICISGMIPEDLSDANGALLSDGSFTFGLPLMINSRIYLFRYRMKPLPEGQPKFFPSGIPLTVAFGN